MCDHFKTLILKNDVSQMRACSDSGINICLDHLRMNLYHWERAFVLHKERT